MSGILTAVSEISEKCRGSVREKILSRKSGLKPFIVSCIFAYVFACL